MRSPPKSGRACGNCQSTFRPSATKMRYCSARCYLIGQSVPNDRGCWIWSGAKDTAGYGVVAINGVRYLTHRLAYETFNSTIDPPDLEVCHTCDTPSCVNARHLFLGSQWDNFIDSVAKRRQETRLTDSDVEHIRSDNVAGSVVAQRLKVSPSLISRVRSGQKRKKYIGTPEEKKKKLTPP